MSNDMRLNHQWSTRPADQRFLTLADLEASVSARRSISREHTTTEVQIALHGEDLGITTGKGFAEMTHWSFGQLCRLGGAPSDYLRTLPPVLAAPALQWSIERREEAGRALKLLAVSNGHHEVRAITSPTYGRIWDLDVVHALQRLGDDWHVPAASYSGRDPKRATTLYASDRDVFVFLCRQEPIEIGNGQVLNRGVMAWNSETGAASFGLDTFTYDRVCDNRIIWDLKDKVSLRFRHTSGAPARMVSEVRPMLSAFASASSAAIVDTVKVARQTIVGNDRESVQEWMRKRGFTRAQASQAYQYAERDSLNQGLNPRSVWGLVQGVTDAAHEIDHTDTRTDLERKAGAMLASV